MTVNNSTQEVARRDLDGIYFNIHRDGVLDSICFSDLTQRERKMVLHDKSREWLVQVYCILADRLRTIGDEFNLVGNIRKFDENEVTS